MNYLREIKILLLEYEITHDKETLEKIKQFQKLSVDNPGSFFLIPVYENHADK